MLRKSKKRRKFRFNRNLFKRDINVYYDDVNKSIVFEMKTQENGFDEVVKKSMKMPLGYFFDDFKFNFRYKEK